MVPRGRRVVAQLSRHLWRAHGVALNLPPPPRPRRRVPVRTPLAGTPSLNSNVVVFSSHPLSETFERVTLGRPCRCPACSASFDEPAHASQNRLDLVEHIACHHPFEFHHFVGSSYFADALRSVLLSPDTPLTRSTQRSVFHRLLIVHAMNYDPLELRQLVEQSAAALPTLFLLFVHPLRISEFANQWEDWGGYAQSEGEPWKILLVPPMGGSSTMQHIGYNIVDLVARLTTTFPTMASRPLNRRARKSIHLLCPFCKCESGFADSRKGHGVPSAVATAARIGILSPDVILMHNLKALSLENVGLFSAVSDAMSELTCSGTSLPPLPGPEAKDSFFDEGHS